MKRFLTFTCLSLSSIALLGCADKPVADPDEAEVIVMDELPPDLGLAGGHPTEGPHGGELIELGNEEYHAELLHDDGSAPTIYLLDGSATEQIAVATSTLLFNMVVDGKPAQLTFTASPEEGAADGKSSRFVCADENAEELMHHHGDARLSVQIDGRGYTGSIHAHDHTGHNH